MLVKCTGLRSGLSRMPPYDVDISLVRIIVATGCFRFQQRLVVDITPDVEDAPVFFTPHGDIKRSLLVVNRRATCQLTNRSAQTKSQIR